MQLRPLLAPLAAIALAIAFATPARAQSQPNHPSHNPALKCTWQASHVQTFTPGSSQVRDQGSTIRTSIVFGTVVGKTEWKIIVLPGYQFGWVYAWDEGVPLESNCSKAYTRTSKYGVIKSRQCCLPQRVVKPWMSGGFQVRARQFNAPGEASAAGAIMVHASNTNVTFSASAAVTTRSDDEGMPVTFQFPLPLGGTLTIETNLDFDGASESTKSVGLTTAGPATATPDEEYVITTSLDLEASADGAPWDTAESSADLTNNLVVIRTAVECKHCLQKVAYQISVNALSVSESEKIDMKRQE